MKKLLAVFLSFLMLFMSTAYAATPLNHRYEWFAMQAPSDELDFGKFLEDLAAYKEANPELMNDDYFHLLSSLGEEALLLEESLDVEEDIFEGTKTVWFPGVKTILEDGQFIVYYDMDGHRVRFTAASIGDDWYNIQKFIMLLDTDERIEVKTADRKYDHTEDHQHVEFLYGSVNFWEKISDPSAITSIAIRFYGKADGDTVDYAMSEEEVSAFSSIVRLSQLREEIRVTLQDWCRSVDDLPLAEQGNDD